MKLIRAIARLFRKRKERNVQYYDHYTMMGTVLGGYSGMLKFGGGRRR